jgi:PAS domain-containing protein
MTDNQKKNIKFDKIPETILNSIPSGIIFCDEDNRICFINHTYAEYLRVNQNEVMGKYIKHYIPADLPPPTKQGAMG